MTKIYGFISKNRKYTVYLTLVIYWIILLTLTSIPSDALPQVAFSDKVKHFIAFTILAYLLYFAFHFSKKFSFSIKKVVVVTILIVILYGAIDEIHQFFIPGRYAEWLDWLADILGGFLGVLIAYYLTIKGKKTEKA